MRKVSSQDVSKVKMTFCVRHSTADNNDTTTASMDSSMDSSCEVDAKIKSKHVI